MSGELKEAIRNLASVPGEHYSKPGKVIALDMNTRTCDVEPVDGSAALFDVKLQANLGSEEGVCFIPKVGSEVIVSWLSKEFAFVSLATQLESVLIKISGAEFNINSNGAALKSSTTTLKAEFGSLIDVIDGLITTLEGFQLNTSGAPGPTIGVMPQVLADLTNHRASLMQFESSLNTLFSE